MKIGNFNLATEGVYIIAELSANHSGDINIAKESISAAKEIGVNAIKLQTYTANMMTLDCDNKDFMANPNNLWNGQKLYDLYSKASLPLDWHHELFVYARTLSIDIFSSPFDKSAVDFLEQFDPIAYKIASFEITDYELIRYTARRGKPIIISTGIATIDEIQDVVDICKSEGNDEIVLLKCTSSYPAPLEDANLLTIPNLAETFGVVPGFSDHTLGIVAPIVATSLGAKVIEKHFILDRSIGGLDSKFSLDKHEFHQMITSIRNAEKLLGKIDYSMTESKRKNRTSSRSLYVAENVKKGELFTDKNVRSIRPGYGIHPKYLKDIIGKKSKYDLVKGTPFELDFL